jgi:hypothetical protein
MERRYDLTQYFVVFLQTEAKKRIVLKSFLSNITIIVARMNSISSMKFIQLFFEAVRS